MELFHQLLGLWSNNFFYKIFLIFTKEFKMAFQYRKWNYPNKKWNYSSHFQASYQKTTFTKCFLSLPRVQKLIFITRNGTTQTGCGIILPTYRPWMKKTWYTECFLFLTRSSKFKHRKWNYSNRNWNYSSPSRPPVNKILLQKVFYFY